MTDRTAIHLRVRSIRQLTGAIKLFELGSDLGEPLPTFEAGAHITLVRSEGKVSHYSLLNDPAERHRYTIAVLRENSGTGGSEWMHDKLAVGDRILCIPPENSFALNENANTHLFIAGGIGITPILSMAQRLSALKAPFTLHYCTRSVSETALYQEIIEIFGDKVVFHHTNGDPFRRLDIKAILADHPVDGEIYVCGPRSMIDQVREVASQKSQTRVHFEVFSSSAPSKAVSPPNGDESFDIELARTGRTLTVPPHKSILAVLNDNGIVRPAVCKEGWCGTCRTRVLSGEIDHRDDILEDTAKANNTFMQICVSRALRGQKLVLDL